MAKTGTNSKVKRGKVIQLPGTPPNATERRKIRAIMKQVSIRKAAAIAGTTPEMYHNVMSGRSRNMTQFNKIIAEAKRLIQERERLVM